MKKIKKNNINPIKIKLTDKNLIINTHKLVEKKTIIIITLMIIISLIVV